ncbi:MAG TPA: hypothetical protein VHT74_26935 [Acetobacteraceae bacterium]|nr:hypothetical protein [Acetobacteraceae bacterium]
MFTTVCSNPAIRWVRPNGSRSRSVSPAARSGSSIVADTMTTAAIMKALMPRQHMTVIS